MKVQAANAQAYTNNKPVAKKTKEETKKTEKKPTNNQPVDRAEINRLLAESRDQTKKFEQLFAGILSTQGKTFIQAWGDALRAGNLREMFTDLEADAESIKKAQELISEDGYFGVKQTSERLLAFAKAYAGNDPAKIEKMRGAFEKGFKAAETAWGGKLPEISYKTREAVLKGFDEMMPKEEETKEAENN